MQGIGWGRRAITGSFASKTMTTRTVDDERSSDTGSRGLPSGKKRLVYFPRRVDGTLVGYVRQHYTQQIKCLSQYFEVVVIEHDCDYSEVCERVAPDIALFELGILHEGYERPTISNTNSHANVPKVGFHNADAFCRSRATTLSEMERLGVEALFALSAVQEEYLPDIADRLFSFPNFIDPDVFRDYGTYKSIPVLFTGSQASFYPWRRRVQASVTDAYPALVSPHRGYQRQKEMRLVAGERYARMINSAWFAATCGTVAREVVRKHFEIPGSSSCLVTERTPAVLAAGFVDMQNCVMADGPDVVEKLDYLFANPDQLDKMIHAGHSLVHTRHTLRHRPQIAQWLEHRNALRSGERIVQHTPFGPVVRELSTSSTTIASGDLGAERRLLADGYALLDAGDIKGARRRFESCVGAIAEIPVPEPRLGLGICHLMVGEAAAAVQWISAPLYTVMAKDRARDPDPVEWAYFMIALLCLGRDRQAQRCAAMFDWMRHTELDRARWLVGVTSGSSRATPLPPEVRASRPTIHPLACTDLSHWVDRVVRMLDRCGRPTGDLIAARSRSQGVEVVPAVAGSAGLATSTSN
jgi:Glycosyl transferases group 1